MKLWRVHLDYTGSGTVEIEADTEAEARRLAEDDPDGPDDFDARAYAAELIKEEADPPAPAPVEVKLWDGRTLTIPDCDTGIYITGGPGLWWSNGHIAVSVSELPPAQPVQREDLPWANLMRNIPAGDIVEAQDDTEEDCLRIRFSGWGYWCVGDTRKAVSAKYHPLLATPGATIKTTAAFDTPLMVYVGDDLRAIVMPMRV